MKDPVLNWNHVLGAKNWAPGADGRWPLPRIPRGTGQAGASAAPGQDFDFQIWRNHLVIRWEHTKQPPDFYYAALCCHASSNRPHKPEKSVSEPGQSINIAMCKEKKLQPAQSINKSHLSVVTVLPVDLLQRDSLAVEVRIKGAATDLIFEDL